MHNAQNLEKLKKISDKYENVMISSHLGNLCPGQAEISSPVFSFWGKVREKC